jgi:hypothetical protein
MRKSGKFILGIAVILIGAAVYSPAHAQSSEPTRTRIQDLDLNTLDPAKPEDWKRLTILSRSEDVPREQRLAFARHQLQKERPTVPYTEIGAHEKMRAEKMLLEQAIGVLARLDDVDSIPLLEQKLVQWEQEAQKPPHEQSQVVPNLRIVRAALARLKAVREVPQVRTSDDLIQRLQRMLVHIEHKGTIQSWLSELEKEVSYNWRMSHPDLGINELILRHYGRMVLQAAWSGVDVLPACEIIQFNPNPEGIAKQQWETYVELAKIPRERIAQWIVDDAVKWNALRVREECLSQVLLDLGTPVIPLIQEKLSWAWRNRDQIEGTGMGLVALTEVLVTLAGEQALPFLEPFTQDKNEWVRHYACRAKEYIQQGKVFVFAPYF